MDELNLRQSAPRGPGFAGGAALLLLASFWMATVFGTTAQPPTPGLRFELRLRRLFETNAPGIRALALPTNAVLYSLGERRGSDRVIAVRSQIQGPVLLLSDELDFERGRPWSRPEYAQGLASIRSHIEKLRSAGVGRIVLLPVPTKASVLAQADPAVAEDACAAISTKGAGTALDSAPTCDGKTTADAYRRLAMSFARDPDITVVSLQDLFVEETRKGAVVYAYEDTHWTSFGMALAAREILRTWRGEALDLVRVGTLPDRPGDLQRMLALPERPSLRTHPLAEARYELPASNASCTSRVFLLGTSYSLHDQGLAAMLERGSRCRVIDLSVSGGDADASFGSLFADRPALDGAVVIWEFPFRSLLSAGAFTRPELR
jgi:hypothetical protein